ncbi:MAG: BatA domain-containing protein [Bacteroidota bacterium]
MNLVNPMYLWGLLGLIVPLAIHLWSKREGRIIQVGSIRNFPVSESKKSRSMRLNETILLLLRSLLITFLVLVLSGLTYQTENTKGSVALVDPSVFNDPEYRTVMDSLTNAPEIELRLFSLRFPLINTLPDTFDYTGRFDHWDLIGALPSLSADHYYIYSKSRLSDFKGKRPIVAGTYDWITLPNRSDEMHLITAFESNSGEIRCIVAHSNDQLLRSEIRDVSDIPNAQTRNTSEGVQVKLNDGIWIPVQKNQPTKVSLFYDRGFEYDAQYLKAATEAIGTYLDINVQVSSLPLENAPPLSDINVWLSIKPPSSPEQYQIIYSLDEFSDQLLVKTKDYYRLTRRLDREVVFREDLVGSLLPLFYNSESVNAQLDSLDSRVLPVDQIQSLGEEKKELGKKMVRANLSNVLWIFVILLLTIERIVAFRRKQ